MRSLSPTSSSFCFHTCGRTHSNCVSAPHSAHMPMAHPSPDNSTGLVEEELDGFGRFRFVASISRSQGIARPRESQMVIKRKVPAPTRRRALWRTRAICRDITRCMPQQNDRCRREGGIRRSWTNSTARALVARMFPWVNLAGNSTLFDKPLGRFAKEVQTLSRSLAF